MTEAKNLRKGNYIFHNDELLRVVKKEVVAYGTHSHSKTKLFVTDIHGKKERSFNVNHHEQMKDADIKRLEGQVIAKMPGKIQVMDTVSYETFDAKVELEMHSQINEGDSITFVNFEGNVTVLEKR